MKRSKDYIEFMARSPDVTIPLIIEEFQAEITFLENCITEGGDPMGKHSRMETHEYEIPKMKEEIQILKAENFELKSKLKELEEKEKKKE